MTDKTIEQRARELLAECLTEFGCDGAGYAVRHKQEEKANLLYPAALRAITIALQQQGGSEGVRGLPAKWRERADSMWASYSGELRHCADELDAALANIEKWESSNGQ